MTETGSAPHEADERPVPPPPPVEGSERPAKRRARGGDDDDASKPSTANEASIAVPTMTRLAAVYSVHRPDSSIFKRGGMKREAPAELAATNEKAKKKDKKDKAMKKVVAEAALAVAATAAATAATAAATKEKQPDDDEEDDAATLRRRLSEMRDAWAAPRRGRGLSGAAWVAATKGGTANEKAPLLPPPPPPPRVARVAPARSKLAPRMGFHHRGLQYLHPEEAAFLVDRGDLVLAVGAAARKREEEEEEEEEKNDGDGDEEQPAAKAAKPAKPSYPPPPPSALEGDPRSARALSVQEAVSLSLSSGVPAGAHQLYSHLMRAGYVVRRNPPVWYLENSKELGEAWGMGRGWRGGGGGGGGEVENDDFDDDDEEEEPAAQLPRPPPASSPPSPSLIPLTASEVRKAKRARAAVDARMARVYGTFLEGGSGASWEALKRKKKEGKKSRRDCEEGGNERDLPRSRRWWPAPGTPGSWLPPIEEDEAAGAEREEEVAVVASVVVAAKGRGGANLSSSFSSPASSSSFSHAPPGLLRLRPFPETPRRSTRRAAEILSSSAPAFAVHRCSATFARRRPAPPASVARLAPRAGPSSAPPSADALAAAEEEVAKDARRAAAEAARAAAAEAEAKAKKEEGGGGGGAGGGAGGGGGGGRGEGTPAPATAKAPAPAPPPTPVVRWAVPRSGGVSYFGFHKVRLAHI